jgi:hypothetical protein
MLVLDYSSRHSDGASSHVRYDTNLGICSGDSGRETADADEEASWSTNSTCTHARGWIADEQENTNVLSCSYYMHMRNYT